MAQVVEVILKHGSCEGPNIAPEGSRTYRETWIVRTDTPVNDFGAGQALLQAAIAGVGGQQLPARGTTFRSDPGAICVEYAPKQDDAAPVVWWIGVTYDSRRDPDDVSSVPPWEKPTRWSWGANRIEEALFWDLDGKAFINAAGDRFDPPPMIPRSNPVLVIEQNRLDYDAGIATAWGDAVNSVPWANRPKRTVKSAFPTATEESAEGGSYWKVTYEFEILVNEDGVNEGDEKWRAWIPTKVLNVGPRYKDAAGKLLLASDDNKVIGGQEVFLKKADGTKIDNPTPDNIMPERAEFRVYREKDFNSLSL